MYYESVPTDAVYVLDDGAILQRLPWPYQTAYANLSSLYLQYVHRYYSHAVVLFMEGAPLPRVKHTRDVQAHTTSVQKSISSQMHVAMKKAFLAKPQKKQRFLNFNNIKLEEAGLEVEQSTGDADYDIVSTACTMAKRRSGTVVGDDTNLLLLLLHHLGPSQHVIFLKIACKVV